MRRLIVAVVSLAAASSAMATEEETTSAHVYQAVVRLGEEVDLVREVMGRPELTTDPWIVVQAEPRHVFYQALTLLRKANRLAVELVNENRAGLLPVPEGEIQHALVLDVIERAAAQIDAVRSELGISYRAETPALEADREPSDVLRENRPGQPAVELPDRPALQDGGCLSAFGTGGYLRRGCLDPGTKRRRSTASCLRSSRARGRRTCTGGSSSAWNSRRWSANAGASTC